MPIDAGEDQVPSFDDLVEEGLQEVGGSVGPDNPLTSEPEGPPQPPQAPKDNAEYTVWYGTNRKPVLKGDVLAGFSSERDSQVHFGQCTVFVPEGHKVGSTGSSFWKRLWKGVDDRLKLIRLEGRSNQQFWMDINQSLKSSNSNDAVVFIHGYNVSFESAAITAAQLGFDLSLYSGMAFFSWPSQGNLIGYAADSASIEASENDIANFLVEFAQKSTAARVHIIAHSMGNRGLLRAISAIVDKAQTQHSIRFGQIILAAADIDKSLFEFKYKSYTACSLRTTLYVSAIDFAVGLAGSLHKFARVGRVPPISTYDGIDTVHVSKIETGFIGHGYVASSRPVINDIFHLIRYNTDPSDRQLHKRFTTDGGVYWELPA